MTLMDLSYALATGTVFGFFIGFLVGALLVIGRDSDG